MYKCTRISVRQLDSKRNMLLH